jgi:hypothetical protein
MIRNSNDAHYRNGDSYGTRVRPARVLSRMRPRRHARSSPRPKKNGTHQSPMMDSFFQAIGTSSPTMSFSPCVNSKHPCRRGTKLARSLDQDSRVFPASIACHGREQQVSPSVRSFPTAPDNYASALNGGFYNHMQNCMYISSELKRALAATRKIHSSQCSSLKFGGSQCKYFNLLFARLGKFKVAAQADPAHALDYTPFGFLQVSSSLILCVTCRMVPIQFLAEDALFYQAPPTPEAMQRRNAGRVVSISVTQQSCCKLLLKFIVREILA